MKEFYLDDRTLWDKVKHWLFMTFVFEGRIYYWVLGLTAIAACLFWGTIAVAAFHFVKKMW